MAKVPGSESTAPQSTEAPSAVSPLVAPAGSVTIAHNGWDMLICAVTVMTSRQLPLADLCFFTGCGFGEYVGHKGIDLYKTPGSTYVARSCPFTGTGVSGATVYPAFTGCSHQATPNKAKVIYAGNHDSDYGTTGIGNCIILEHTDNTHQVWLRTVYMHLATVSVAAGDFVGADDAIGTVGYTGGYSSTNAHLHFEINFQVAANPNWRVAGELALMPAYIVGNRPAIDPELLLPSVYGGEVCE